MPPIASTVITLVLIVIFIGLVANISSTRKDEPP